MRHARASVRAARFPRAAVVLAALTLVAAAALTGAGCGSGADGYRVRAVFDNAGNVIPGEDVKIAGVKVGRVDSLDVTPDQKAAVVLGIATPGFEDFRTDATCIVRPQSLIGEKFVECTPTQARPEGAPAPPALAVIPRGQAGAGERLLPVSRTSSPVDLDLLGDILRLPYRQRLTILINELGTGLAGQGGDLRDVIRRADPALAQTDRVLAILAAGNRTLAQLARDSDRAIAPLAQHRQQVADWVARSATVATASAAQQAALDRSLADLPTFLRQLTPTLAQLGQLADQTTPVLSDLAGGAPQIDRAVTHLRPFAQSATPFLQSLGAAAVQGVPAAQAATPVAGDLGELGAQARPFAAGIAPLLASVRSTGGIERLLDFIYTGAAATNGYDALGHYLRAGLVVNPCSTYAVVPAEGCSANFAPAPAPAPASATAPVNKKTAAKGKKAPAKKAIAPAARAAGASVSNVVGGALLGYLLGR